MRASALTGGVAVWLALALVACGGEDGGGDGLAGEQGVTEGAKAAPTLEQARTGSDNQRAQAIQRLEAKSSGCDVYQADVIWTAEFASQKWIMDLTAYVEGRANEFIPSTLAPLEYDGRYWSVPQVTGAGLIYRRTDQVRTAPETWQELYALARDGKGFSYQGAAYEGLTVNFLEVAFAAGGGALSADGSEARFDTPQNREALELMVAGIEDGGAVKAAPTFMEEEARQAFEGGVLGGNGPILSAFAQNPEGGLLFIDHLTSPATLERNMARFSLPSTLKATYDRPAVKEAVPYAAQLLEAIAQAKPRPVSPVYPQISQAISQNVNKALAGEQSPAEALKRGQDEIAKALETF